MTSDLGIPAQSAQHLRLVADDFTREGDGRFVPNLLTDGRVGGRGGEEVAVVHMSKLLLDVRRYVTERERAGLIAKTTAKNERNVLSQFALEMGQRDVRQIGKTDILRWLASIDHLEAGTKASRFRVVRRYFEHLLDQDRPTIRRSPFRGIKPPKTPKGTHRALTGEQIAALLAAAPHLGAVVAILLGVQSGLRVSEAAGVQLGDIDWRRSEDIGRIRVVGKGNKPRIVPMPQQLRDAADDYLSSLGTRWSGPLLRLRRFPSRGVTGQHLSDEFRAIALGSGVKRGPGDGVSFHSLRHTFATDVYRECQDILVVRDLCGHSDVKTTDGYTAGARVDDLIAAAAGRHYGQAA